MINVQTSSASSKLILDTGFSAIVGALGAGLVQSPIGPAGGALFGLVRQLASIQLKRISANILNVDAPFATQSAKTLAAVLEFFGRYAVTWGVLGAVGMPMALWEVVALEFGSFVSTLALAIIIGLLGMQASFEWFDLRYEN